MLLKHDSNATATLPGDGKKCEDIGHSLLLSFNPQRGVSIHSKIGEFVVYMYSCAEFQCWMRFLQAHTYTLWPLH